MLGLCEERLRSGTSVVGYAVHLRLLGSGHVVAAEFVLSIGVARECFRPQFRSEREYFLPIVVRESGRRSS